MSREHRAAVLFDVDGTLVDSNDAHAHAWVAAFAEHGMIVDFTQVRRSIGMGGDKLVPHVSGIPPDSDVAHAIAERRRQIFADRYLPYLRSFEDAGRLVATLKASGHVVVAASSARRDELQPLLAIADAEALMDAATSSDDAEHSKPDPDIIHAALHRARVDASDAVMIGDTPYDIEAAGRAGVAVIAVRCGGWSDEDLGGAVAIYDGPWDLLHHLDRAPLLRGLT